MSIQEEIIEWSQGQPVWRQNVIAKLVRGESITDDEIALIATGLVDGTTEMTTQPVQVHDFSTGQAEAKRVSLTSISDLRNVNALRAGETLTFDENGLTVIYGDNGSGKSGYARLIKSAVGARHDEQVLPHAFDPVAGSEQGAAINYKVDDQPYQEKWPVDDTSILRQIHFYDEHCGDVYVESDTEVKFRLSILKLFDNLVVVTERVSRQIEQLLTKNQGRATALPRLDGTTASTEFIAKFSSTTTVAEIDAICSLPGGSDERLAVLVNEGNRLRATNPESERRRLQIASVSLEALASGLEEIHRLLDPVSQGAAVQILDDAVSLRQAATIASAQDFSGEPLAGVGSVTWRALWSAAEAYVTEEIPATEFPSTQDGARCPLCQQALDGDGSDRIRRFHHFVHNETEKSAKNAEAKLDALQREIAALVTSSSDWSAATTYLDANDTAAAEAVKQTLTTAALAKTRLAERLGGAAGVELVDVVLPDIARLKELAKALKEQSDNIDSTVFQKQLADIEREKVELEHKSVLAQVRSDLLKERERLIERKKIENVASKVSTRGVTTKATDLTRQYVTSAMADRFTRESQSLKLERLKLGDRGGSKAKQRQRPELIGTSGAHRPRDILSEGEQTALGLAGLFTEVYFDDSKSTLVLDDPVSSLDHERRSQVAERLVELAKERQVIVFTHDLSFAGYLARSAKNKKVHLEERVIERSGSRVPGSVGTEHPWKAKDARRRLGDLEAELARIKKDCASWNEEAYSEKVSAWAGKLSQTWERILRTEVINPVVDRATEDVQPSMLKVLVRISEKDNSDFQEGYSKVTEWVARHDQSEDKSTVPPTTEELDAELKRARTWFERVKGYKA
ncbi:MULTISPECIES: AAA family ATPase [Mycobacteroides]|nr:AAA family ATPase [Mycobacteroides abscessus]